MTRARTAFAALVFAPFAFAAVVLHQLGPEGVSAWAERAQRIPLPVLEAPSRATVAQGGGAVRRVDATAHVFERHALPTTSPVVAIAGDVAGAFDDGLFRLDGSRFAPEVDARTNGLAAAPDGRLYVATNGGAFEVSPDGASQRIAAGAFTAVTMWRGTAWFASRRGLSVLEPVDAPASGLRPPPGEAGPAPGFWTRGAEQGVAADSPAALADCGVVLCVGALDGLWLFDGERATRLSSASGALPSDWVTAIASDGAAIWAGTFESGVARIGLLPSIRTNVRAFSSVRRYAPSDGLPEGRVQPQAALVREGALYAATPRGLLVVRGDEAALVPMGEVTALAPAARGFWIGARGEVARIAVHFGGGVL